jgi:hypothetical protein
MKRVKNIGIYFIVQYLLPLFINRLTATAFILIKRKRIQNTVKVFFNGEWVSDPDLTDF